MDLADTIETPKQAATRIRKLQGMYENWIFKIEKAQMMMNKHRKEARLLYKKFKGEGLDLDEVHWFQEIDVGRDY